MEQFWSAAAEAEKEKRTTIVVAVLAVLLTTLAMTAIIRFVRPAQTYESCVRDAADQAKGNATIFLHINSATCIKLKPGN